jgi:hypothetical protein
MKKKRIMWLINHTTLREFEVPLLIDMGYEVFCPKSFPYNEGNLSASIEWKYDESLSIPKLDLEKLNSANFYDSVTNEITLLMNKHFDIVFFVAIREQIKMVINSFHGVLIFRTFGLAGEGNYAENIILSCGYSTMLKIESIGNRFFFGYGYKSMLKVEVDFMRNHGIYLPLGLKNAEINNSWVGKDKKILFVCPRINTSPYFYEVYEKFKKDFSEFDYLIGGAQPIPVVNDSKVLGYIPKEQYEYNMRNLAVMFYHSKEKRHIHYHPFEAIKNGMPLIFMSGGLLDSIGGSDLPGRCRTVSEARRKIHRIINGDQKFIRHVVDRQRLLLDVFKYEYCRKSWESAFNKIDKPVSEISTILNSIKKIAILLPGKTSKQRLRKIKSILKVIKETMDIRGEHIEIVLGYTDSNLQEEFYDIIEIGISTRMYQWRDKTKDWVNNSMTLRGYPFNQAYGTYCVPDDGINFFNDCDYIMFTDINVKKKIFLEKPYGFFVESLNQRYLEYEVFKSEQEILDNMRNSNVLFCFNAPTRDDIVQYVGVREDMVFELPEIIDQYSEKKIISQEYNSSYFLWQTSNFLDENIEKFIDILQNYYECGGQLKCVLMGEWTEELYYDKRIDTKNKAMRKTRNRLKVCTELKKHFIFLKDYELQNRQIAKNAKFILNVDSVDEDMSMFLEQVNCNNKIVAVKSRKKNYYEKLWNMNFNYIELEKKVDVIEFLLEYESIIAPAYTKMPSITTSFIANEFYCKFWQSCV